MRGVTGELRKLSREEKRRQRRASAKYRLAHATRERMRVEVGQKDSLFQKILSIAGLQLSIRHPAGAAAYTAPG